MAAISTSINFEDGDQVTSAKLNGIISGTTVAADAITGDTLAVVGGRLKVNTITSSEMGPLSVATAALIDEAVTTDKLATSSVTTAKVTDANITAAKLDGAQTGDAPVFGIRAWAQTSGLTVVGSGNIGTPSGSAGSGYVFPFITNMNSTDYGVVVNGNATSVTKNIESLVLNTGGATLTTSSFIVIE